MTIENNIRTKIEQSLTPSVFDIVNESHMHSGPATNSHFKLTIVSTDFEGVRPVARHQMVYKVLAEELAGEVHALALHTYSNEEWQVQSKAPQSPNCQGANKG